MNRAGRRKRASDQFDLLRPIPHKFSLLSTPRLAARAKVSAARGLDDALDFAAALVPAQFVRAVIYAQAPLIKTSLLVVEIKKRVGFSARRLHGNGAAKFYRVAQNLADSPE